MIRGMTAPSFMDLALKTAKNAAKAGEVPIGCVIVRGYEVIATAGNRTLTDRDPTAHAEILAIRQAADAIGTERLVDCDLYVTLEPCTMCAGAISFARIRRLYYGAADPKGGAVNSGVRFFASADLSSRAGGVFGGGRDRGGDAAEGFFQGEEVSRTPLSRHCERSEAIQSRGITDGWIASSLRSLANAERDAGNDAITPQ